MIVAYPNYVFDEFDYVLYGNDIFGGVVKQFDSLTF